MIAEPLRESNVRRHEHEEEQPKRANPFINGNHNVFKFSSKAIDIEVLIMSWFREFANPYIQANLDLRNPIFPFFNRELFDLRKIYVLNLKTGCSKKLSYVGEFAS